MKRLSRSQTGKKITKTTLGGPLKYTILILGLLSSLNLLADTTANIRKGVMLYGYDPVSYFSSSKPVQGKVEIKAVVNGLTYQFATEENKKEFLAHTTKYEPQYEGWCATAVAGGYKNDIDPENYKITDGKLYLFYKGWKGDAKKDWVKSEPEFVKKADTNWPQVKTSKE